MRNNLILLVLVIASLFVYGCAQPGGGSGTQDQKPSDVDVVSETGETKTTEKSTVSAEKEQKAMSADVKELLGIADKKIKSISYKYKGPQTKDFFYEFSVKGDKVKYILDPTYKFVDFDDDAYDAVYIDNGAKTALAYCDDRKCKVKGKKATLNYNEANIKTALDWLDDIEYAEKVGEGLIEQRTTWKLSSEEVGSIWIDTFYGVPLKVEFAGNEYTFSRMTFNDVSDGDVTPS